MINSFARLRRADDYKPGMPESIRRLVLDQIRLGWGKGASLDAGTRPGERRADPPLVGHG